MSDISTLVIDAAVYRTAQDTEQARRQAPWMCPQWRELRGRVRAPGDVPTGTGPGANAAGGKETPIGAAAGDETGAVGPGAESVRGNEQGGGGGEF